MTEQESKAFQLGVKTGREQVIKELQDLLGLENLIAEAIQHHERLMHGIED